MKSIFSVSDPSGNRQHLSEKGEELTREEAIATAFEFWPGDVEGELERRAKAWSWRHDCHVREPLSEEI